ncbi:MAG: hypothetical protein ACOY4F_03020 [Thermodesulfobacteriota bacterium]
MMNHKIKRKETAAFMTRRTSTDTLAIPWGEHRNRTVSCPQNGRFLINSLETVRYDVNFLAVMLKRHNTQGAIP